MGCNDGKGPGSGTGEDRSKVIDLRERILQLAGHDCHEEGEKSRAELLEDLSICKRDTLIELCHSFDITGSRANRKEELVSFLMKFLSNNCSRTDAVIPVKVSDLREQILQVTGHPCHDEEDKSRTELLVRLSVCKRDTLIELCRSFDLIGSRANRKEELVSFLMTFVKEHSSAIDGANRDKKIKKRRRMKEEENLSCGKPLKKKKQETTLGTWDEEEANVSKVVENRRNYLEFDGKDSKYPCTVIENGKVPNEKANLETSICTNEQALPTTPSSNVVTPAEVDSTKFKASKKNSFVTQKNATPVNDHQLKSGKKGSKGDVNARKQATKPTRDELREAIVLILDSTDFATMTFGNVVKEVDKYFGKDLFERKPLIRSLIEGELFRLSEEAEKKELEEEEAAEAEAKARVEQSTKKMIEVHTVETRIDKQNSHIAGQVHTVETGIDKRNNHIAGQSYKTKDCGNGHEKDDRDGSSVKRNSSAVAEGLHNGKVGAGTKIEDNEPRNDGKCEKLSPSKKNDVDMQGSINGNGEHDATDYGRTEGGKIENGNNNPDDSNKCGAEESRRGADDERVEHAGNGKTKEVSNENSSNVAIHSDNDGKEKEGNIDAEHNLTDCGSDGKAEYDVHNANTKVDVDSCKNGATVSL